MTSTAFAQNNGKVMISPSSWCFTGDTLTLTSQLIDIGTDQTYFWEEKIGGGMWNENGGHESTYKTATPADHDVHCFRLRVHRHSENIDPQDWNYYSDSVCIRKCSITPVDIISFKATKQGNSIKIEWKSASEINVKQYIVERSTDARTFVPVSIVQSTQTNAYEMTDMQVPANTKVVFYRLKIEEQTGSIQHSIVSRISLDGKVTTLSVYPNPVTGNHFTVSAENIIDQSKTRIQIFDAFARKVYDEKFGEVRVNLRAGLYICKIVTIDGVELSEAKLVKN